MILQDKVKEFHEYEAKTEAMKKRLDALEARYKKRWASNHWIDTFIKPLAVAMCEKIGTAKWEIMWPFGLGCEISIWFWDTDEQYKESKIKSITLHPDYYNDNPCGVTVKDYAQKHALYPANSFAALNGLNYAAVTPLPDADLDWFIQYVTKIR